MKNESVSPEERLFKIIQQEKKAPPVQDNPAQGKGSPEWMKGAKEKALIWKAKLASLAQDYIEKARAGFSGKSKEIKLRTINIALFVLLILLVISAVYYAVAKYPNAAKIINATVKAQGALPAPEAEIEQFKPANYYTGDAARRDIFIASHGVASSGAEAAAAEETKGSSGDFKLQGIAWSDVPKALIQAGRDDRMYVVKEGQAIGVSGVKVKNILKNKVILTDGEKDFEL